MTDENPIATVRTAYGYVVAYQRRVLDALAAMRDALIELEYQFRSWEALRTTFPKMKRFEPDYFAWDSVPLTCCRFEWAYRGQLENREGNSWFWLEHVADTGFEHAPRGREPDPLTSLPPVENTASVFRARWLKFHAPVSEQRWNLSWDALVANVFGEAFADVWPLEPTNQPVESTRDGLVVGGHVVLIDDLRSGDDFRVRMIDPVLAGLRALHAPD